ncbi:MAG: DUF6069 family protein [Aquihabitans sp.]
MATITRTTSTTPSTSTDTGATTKAQRASLRKATLAVGAVAAIATTAAAAALHAAGVSFAIDGEAIPLLGFAQMAFLWTLVGGVLAGSLRKRSAHPRLRWIQTTIVLTVLSCIPSVTAPASPGTKAALCVTHLVAAAIVIPVLARRLAE